jgi:mRNA interferase RelE/StbE
MSYRLGYKNSAQTELRKLTKLDRSAIIKKIGFLKEVPYPEGSANLKGSQNLHRIRRGDYKVICKINKQVVIVTKIRTGHRREIYKNL